MSRISKFTVGRLYNLGNYEHIRYELTVDIAEGDDAAEAIVGVERILAGLAPDKSIKDFDSIRRDEERIQRMRTMSAVDWEREYRHHEGTPSEVIARYEEALVADKKRREESITRQRRARDLFNDLGGAEKFTDAKLSWDDNQY